MIILIKNMDIIMDTLKMILDRMELYEKMNILSYVDGLTKIGGQSKAPTDLKSYCGEFINLVYSVSSQFMGAVATPEFLMCFDYF